MEKRANTRAGAGPGERWLIARRFLVVNRMALVLLVGIGSPILTLMPESTQAQSHLDLFDFNGDDRVTCADFIEEFPSTYTEEATEALRQFPDELRDLNRDNDATACDSTESSAGGDPADDEPLDAPLDPTPVPSDLPPTAASPSQPRAAALPDAEGCDVNVRAGRAYVITDCADGTVDAGFTDFAGFDDFAASAENGFGAFDDTSGFSAPSVVAQQPAAPAVIEAEQAAPDATAAEPATDGGDGGDDASIDAAQGLPTRNNRGERQPASSDTRAAEREQPARPETSRAKPTAKSRQAARERLKKKRARQRQLKLNRAKQRRARIEAARAKQRQERQDGPVRYEQRPRDAAPRR